MAQFMKLLVTIALTTIATIAIFTTKTTTATARFALEDPVKDLTPPGAVKIKPSQGPKPLNLIAADGCQEVNEICSSSDYRNGANTTVLACCNNKCMNLSTDNKNCGACGNECKFLDTCCGGECVSVAYDKRNCGKCNNSCDGLICLYGLCL